MRVFRIALRKFGATAREALSGQSGFLADGRWHTHGRYLDYGAENRSLAALERLVHYRRFDCLAPHVIYTVEVPSAHIETVLALPKGWDGAGPLPAAQAIGDAWCDQVRSPALQVRSTVTPGEHNLMLNTHHPAWDWKWVVAGPDEFAFDSRLVELMKKAP